MNRFTQRSATAVTALAIAAAGFVGSGCGEDDVNDAVNEAQEKGDKAVEEAKQAPEDATVPEDVQKQLDEAQKKADEAIEKAKDETGVGGDGSSDGSGGGGY